MNNEPTETLEEESKRLIAEFLEKGGKITQCDYAATTPIEDRPKPAWAKTKDNSK